MPARNYTTEAMLYVCGIILYITESYDVTQRTLCNVLSYMTALRRKTGLELVSGIHMALIWKRCLSYG